MFEAMESSAGDATFLTFTGKLDAATTPNLQKRLLDLIREGKKFLALDFSKVTYLASSGLRMLLVVVREINALEGRLVLCGMDEAMLGTMEITGFKPYFHFAATLNEGGSFLAD